MNSDYHDDLTPHNGHFSVVRGPGSSNVQRSYYNVTSIIDAFENGTFRSNYDASLAHALGVNVTAELDSILLKLNSELVPCVLNDTKIFDKKEVSEWFDKINQIKLSISKLYKFRKNSINKHRKSHDLVCTTCRAVVPIKYDRSSPALEKHAHFDEAFIHFANLSDTQFGRLSVHNCNTSDSSSLDASEMDENISRTDEQSFSETGITSTTISDSSINDSITPAANLHYEMIKPKEFNCSNCALKVNFGDFKFNFQISYDPIIAKSMYRPREYDPKLQRILTEIGEPFLQFKSKQLFSCLICRCEVPSHVDYKIIRQHCLGSKHLKLKLDNNVIAALLAYHENWKQREAKYQAHQTYFSPLNQFKTLCDACGHKGTVVSYDLLEEHINSERHRESFFKSCKKRKKNALLNCLLKLQGEVYAGEFNLGYLEENEHEKKKFETRQEDLLEPQTSENATATNVVNIETTAARKNGMATKLDGSSVNAKQTQHLILKSIENTSGTELNELLEYRFLSHLKCFVPNDEGTLKCQSCKKIVRKYYKDVRAHICSGNHQIKANLRDPFYKFYCAICNVILRQNKRWDDHLRQKKHIERCKQMHNTPAEYHCKTCSLVIFGCDSAIKRHSATKNVKFLREKEIVLNVAAKNLFKSEQHIQAIGEELANAANEVLANQEPVLRCCHAIETALATVYPKCKAHPFGSRVSGLGSEASDLDVFVDMGDMYMGQNNQDSRSQEKFVNAAYKVFRKKRVEFENVNSIPTARTPIVQVMHSPSGLDCDLSFRHGLSVENTKFLRFCIDVQPIIQPMILLLKKWIACCQLQENITTYALSMMVIFHMQVGGYLKPVHELRQLNPDNFFVIDGWGVMNFSKPVPSLRDHVVPCLGPVTAMLKEFFYYYSKFNYSDDIVCPLLGRPVRKALFFEKINGEDLPLEMLAYVQKVSSPGAEYFRAHAPFCIQDPFDLSHNLVKACTPIVVVKFQTFCDLTLKHLNTIGC